MILMAMIMVMIISIEWLMKMMIFHAQDELLCVSNEDIVDNEDDCDEDW